MCAACGVWATGEDVTADHAISVAATANNTLTVFPPERSSRPASAGRSSRIDHEFEEVPVGVADVDARPLGLPTALAQHRTLDDGGLGAVEPGLEGGGRAIPDEAEIA